jgi:ABC-2 type transport system ATP-binding protein
MDHVIATEGLTRRFGRLDAVNQLTMQVPAGSIFGLIGPNGAGKTTTLKLLMNILRPTGGRAAVLGVDSQRLGPAEFASIGYVSENQHMPDWMTVRQLLAYCKPFYPAWDDRLSTRLIELMALPLDRKIKHLSRGMRMKAALVSSLAYRPKLLILDEPFSGLDPLMRDEFVQGVLELAGEGGWSAVISSHDLEEIERLIDWVGYLRDGQLAFSESITGLQARFRQIDVSLPSDASASAGAGGAGHAGGAGGIALPSPIPAAWLNVTTGDRALRFVHARYTPEATEQELATRFPDAQFQVTPISLRETFIALAKHERAGSRAANRHGDDAGVDANAGKLVLS